MSPVNAIFVNDLVATGDWEKNNSNINKDLYNHVACWCFCFFQLESLSTFKLNDALDWDRTCDSSDVFRRMLYLWAVGDGKETLK